MSFIQDTNDQTDQNNFRNNRRGKKNKKDKRDRKDKKDRGNRKDRKDKKGGRKKGKKIKPKNPTYYLARDVQFGSLEKVSRTNKLGETIYECVCSRSPLIAAMTLWKNNKRGLGGQVIHILDESDNEYSFDSKEWSIFDGKNWKFNSKPNSRRK
mgnify:CR=1 FL=1